MSSLNWDYVLKFVIIGDAAVGKSSLLVRLTDQRFLSKPDPTLGVEFGSKLIVIPEDGKTVKLQCWDTAGTESFRSITRSYYRGAAGALLVYDVTSRASFEHARGWLADVREHADPNLTCILVANKVDLCAAEGEEGTTSPPQSTKSGTCALILLVYLHTTKRILNVAIFSPKRDVSRAEGEQFAKEEGLLFIEASAKTGENVDRAFEEATRDILSKIKRGVFDDNKSPGVKSTKPRDNPNALQLEDAKTSGGCC
ncbi:GTP-binding protein YPTC4 [Ceratobasidium sp. AG-Ba]|nr:GTP-binding protein YPTC4 [Ceratobasidium sp. AG-Ba]